MIFVETKNTEVANLLAMHLHDFQLNKRTLPYIITTYREVLGHVANGSYLKPLININRRDDAIKYGYNMYLKLCGLSVKGMKTIGSPMTKPKPVMVGMAVIEQVIEYSKKVELEN